MDYNEPAPPKSNTATILAVVFGLLFAVFGCCGGLAYWGFVKGSSLASEAQSTFADFTRISAEVSARFHVQASLGINVQSTNGVSSRTWTLTLGSSPYDAVAPETRHEAARTIAAYTRSIVGTATPPTQICITWQATNMPDCFPYAELANVPVPPEEPVVEPVPAIPVPADPLVDPAPPKP